MIATDGLPTRAMERRVRLKRDGDCLPTARSGRSLELIGHQARGRRDGVNPVRDVGIEEKRKVELAFLELRTESVAVAGSLSIFDQPREHQVGAVLVFDVVNLVRRGCRAKPRQDGGPCVVADPVGPVRRGCRPMLRQWDPLESTCRHASLSIL